MISIPPYNFNFSSGIQMFESTYHQYLENDLLTIMHTDENETIIVNYKLNKLSSLSNHIDEETFKEAYDCFLDFVYELVQNNMPYLCNVNKILRIKLKDEES